MGVCRHCRPLPVSDAWEIREENKQLLQELAMAQKSSEMLAFNTARGFNSQKDELEELHADIKEMLDVCVMTPNVKQDRAIETFLAKHPELA